MDFRMIGVPWGLFLFLIFKDFIHKALVLLVVLICGRIVKLLQQFFLLPRQILWHFDGHPNKLVTSASTAQILHTFILQLEDIAGLGTLMNMVCYISIQGWHSHVGAQCRLGEGNRQFAPNIVPSALENRVRLYTNGQQQVTCGTAVHTSIALAGYF